MSDHELGGELETITKRGTSVKRPKLYRVFLLNDDYTTMDFVISILETIFRKTPAESVQIMLKVHRSGKGLCGLYTKQIAEAKVSAVHARARSAGYPLRCIMEQE